MTIEDQFARFERKFDAFCDDMRDSLRDITTKAGDHETRLRLLERAESNQRDTTARVIAILGLGCTALSVLANIASHFH